MKVLHVFFGGLTSVGAMACDFQLDGVENIENKGKTFSVVKNYVDENGETRTFKNMVIPLNEETQRSLVRIASEGTSACLYGTYSRISPKQYFIYRAE